MASGAGAGGSGAIRLKKKPYRARQFFYCFGGLSCFHIILQLVSVCSCCSSTFPGGQGVAKRGSEQRRASGVAVQEPIAGRPRFFWRRCSRMIIVFYLKAYQSPRHFTWLTGVFSWLWCSCWSPPGWFSRGTGIIGASRYGSVC